MRISAKSRYAVASLTYMGQLSDNELVTLSALSERLKISKIYLEQVFSLLRLSGIVTAAKGAQGGYRLTRPTSEITVLDVLAGTEAQLFDKPEKTVEMENIERAMRSGLFEKLDAAVRGALSSVTIADLAALAGDGGYMYYL
ncbi:MAG: Rrf2 family transcriptional regulator [Clostridiales bacterium]|jgi:Rrf2 family protein|nr:Rrf2 family transcriptional regulator [Clostridiales bacterium]